MKTALLFAGQGDRTLRILEQELGVDVHARGNEVRLMGAEAAGADFTDANMTGANLRKTDVENARFTGIQGRQTIVDLATAENLKMAIFD